MKLSPEDVNLYYKLLWSLCFYADKQLKIIGTGQSLEDFEQYSLEQKAQVTETVFAKSEIIKSFVNDNPDNFTELELGIVSSWKHGIMGKFYIERHLKDYSVFIDNNSVYGVIGLVDEISDIYPKMYLPGLIKTILLPFKEHIIYVGHFQNYNVTFGSGITSGLKQDYMKAKQRGTIITSLGKTAQTQQPKAKTATIDWQPTLDELTKLANTLKGGNNQPSINGPVFSLVKASIELATNAVKSENSDTLYKSTKKVNNALNKVISTLQNMDDEY